MSLAEREFRKKVDEAIMTASPEELKKIQELDLESQLQGATFYDIFIKTKPNSKYNFATKTQTINKKGKK